jgi:hypothetical protein
MEWAWKPPDPVQKADAPRTHRPDRRALSLRRINLIIDPESKTFSNESEEWSGGVRILSAPTGRGGG